MRRIDKITYVGNPEQKQEETNQAIIVIANKKEGTKLIDCIKFGVGFYIGFKLARTVKYGLVNSVKTVKTISKLN